MPQNLTGFFLNRIKHAIPWDFNSTCKTWFQSFNNKIDFWCQFQTCTSCAKIEYTKDLRYLGLLEVNLLVKESPIDGNFSFESKELLSKTITTFLSQLQRNISKRFLRINGHTKKCDFYEKRIEKFSSRVQLKKQKIIFSCSSNQHQDKITSHLMGQVLQSLYHFMTSITLSSIF